MPPAQWLVDVPVILSSALRAMPCLDRRTVRN